MQSVRLDCLTESYTIGNMEILLDLEFPHSTSFRAFRMLSKTCFRTPESEHRDLRVFATHEKRHRKDQP